MTSIGLNQRLLEGQVTAQSKVCICSGSLLQRAAKDADNDLLRVFVLPRPAAEQEVLLRRTGPTEIGDVRAAQALIKANVEAFEVEHPRCVFQQCMMVYVLS